MGVDPLETVTLHSKAGMWLREVLEFIHLTDIRINFELTQVGDNPFGAAGIFKIGFIIPDRWLPVLEATTAQVQDWMVDHIKQRGNYKAPHVAKPSSDYGLIFSRFEQSRSFGTRRGQLEVFLKVLHDRPVKVSRNPKWV